MFGNAFNMWLYHLIMFLHNFVQKYIVNVKDDIISRIVNLM